MTISSERRWNGGGIPAWWTVDSTSGSEKVELAGSLGLTGYIDVLEEAEPAAPPANTGRLFVKDTAGKSQLLVRFPSGASQVIATEP